MEVNFKDRYYLFNITQYYPSGGLGDVVATSNDFESLKKYAFENHFVSDGEIFDRIEGIRIDLE